MASDGSVDEQIKALEVRIRDHRIALRDSMDDLGQQARMMKQRIRKRATSPLVWGGALIVGFVAARLARSARMSHHRPVPARWRPSAWRTPEEKPVSTGRRVLGAVLSAAAPIALRVARQSAGPWIARQVQAVQQAHARRRAYERGYARD